MSNASKFFDGAERVARKEASRRSDAARLSAGEISARDLHRENDAFASIVAGDVEFVNFGGFAIR